MLEIVRLILEISKLVVLRDSVDTPISAQLVLEIASQVSGTDLTIHYMQEWLCLDTLHVPCRGLTG